LHVHTLLVSQHEVVEERARRNVLFITSVLVDLFQLLNSVLKVILRFECDWAVINKILEEGESQLFFVHHYLFKLEEVKGFCLLINSEHELPLIYICLMEPSEFLLLLLPGDLVGHLLRFPILNSCLHLLELLESIDPLKFILVICTSFLIVGEVP
jgi:hypothetical protein